MKILIATPLYPPEPGGPATYAKLLEDGLPSEGIELELAKFSDVRHLPKFIRHVAYFFRVLPRMMRADLVLVLDTVSTGFPVALASFLMRKRYVVKIVGDHAWEQGKQHYGLRLSLDEFVRIRRIPIRLRVYRAVQTFVAQHARAVIVPSAYLRGVIVDGWGIPAENVHVIHNAISPETGGTVPETVLACKEPRVVFVGRLVPWKGVQELIEAVAAVRKKKVKLSLVIVGDGPERKRLEEVAIKKLQTEYCFTGSLSHEDAYATLSACDVFVLDSLYEGLSHTLIEAFMAGVPVIASDIGGNREIVRGGENGLLVAPQQVEPLAGALEQVLKDESLRRKLAEGAKASGTDFSVEVMVSRVSSLLSSI